MKNQDHDPDPKIMRAAFREVIENQIKNNDPPETKATFDRLIAEGHSEKEAWRLLSALVAIQTFNVIKHKRPFDLQEYIGQLNELPKLPLDD
jgi:hypothetical protein